MIPGWFAKRMMRAQGKRAPSLWPKRLVALIAYSVFFFLSAAGASTESTNARNSPNRFEASGRFGLRLEQAERVLHLQGLFEVKTDHQLAQVELFDPAGQRLLLWKQDAGGEALIETARDGPSSAVFVQQWLQKQGVKIDIDQLDAWRWRRWLELAEGRFSQGGFVIERSPKKLVIEQAQGSKLRLIIVPSEKP